MKEKKYKQYKVYVKDEKTKDNVIKHGRHLGYDKNEKLWLNGTLKSMDYCFLFFWYDGFIYGETEFETFKSKTIIEELYPEQFLALTIDDVLVKEEPEEKRVWDIEPGDLVLVRNGRKSRWDMDIYKRFGQDERFVFIGFGGGWNIIIKYTPEIKKYIETTDGISGAWEADDLEEIKRQIEERENKPELTIEWLKENLNVGDKVRIKTLEEYEKMSDKERQPVYLHMKECLGEILEVTIKKSDHNFFHTSKTTLNYDLNPAWHYNMIAEHFPQDQD